MIISSEQTNDALIIDPTSKAARVSLYDSSGRLINRPTYDRFAVDPKTYSYMVSARQAPTPTAFVAAFLNTGDRRVRPRHIQVFGNNVGTSNVEAFITVSKCYLGFPSFTTGATAFFGSTAKRSRSPGASGVFYAQSNAAMVAPRYYITQMGSLTCPLSTNISHNTLDLFFDEDGPDGAFYLEHGEAITFDSGANSFVAVTYTIDWDEEPALTA
jgi:hypothetical protein